MVPDDIFIPAEIAGNEDPYEVIFDDDLKELTRHLSPLLLFAKLNGIKNNELARILYKPSEIKNLSLNGPNGQEGVKFIGLRYRLITDVIKKTGSELHLAVMPTHDRDDTKEKYERIWVLYGRDKTIGKGEKDE
jgi:hypothetical protein